MTPEERIDANIEKLLNAAGTSFRHYSMDSSRQRMREIMRQIMSESYIKGSNDHAEALKDAEKRMAKKANRP